MQKWKGMVKKVGVLLLATIMLVENSIVGWAREDSVSQNEMVLFLKDEQTMKEGIAEDDAVEIENETVSASELKNPVHHCDVSKQHSVDYTEFSYVYFGSYPQTEVTDSSIIAKIDSKIQGVGDVWIDDVKYRKISSADTNYDFFFHEDSSATYRYFKWERIKWRVLYTNGNKAFLMADNSLDCQEYNEKPTSVTWENSSLRKWLNGYSGFEDRDRNNGKSFTAANFYETAFHESEQKVILQEKIKNPANPDYGTAGGNTTNDKVFLISLADSMNKIYGFCDSYNCQSSSRWVKATDYSHAMGTKVYQNKENTGGERNTWWWLRTPGASDSEATEVDGLGAVLKNGYLVTGSSGAVAPAIYLNLQSDTWVKTDDGTSGKGGNNTSVDKPKETSKLDRVRLSTVKNNSPKCAVIKWKKVKNGTLYEVQYTTDKKFGKNIKKKKVKKTSYTIKKLKKGKSYYVRVRAGQKDKNGKIIYGAWSKVKKVKIRK